VPADGPGGDGRARSTVDREDLQIRMPRSAPDALRYEPGVFIQQTAHAQGSPYIRGRTGQQTVLLFDHVRLNNSTFRQGPNQYFFTIDSHTIDSIDILRGSASTRYGSDAMAGVVHAHPLEPTFGLPGDGLRLAPRGLFRYGSADGEVGGRGQIEASVGDAFGLIGGLGYRSVGLLEAGGPVYNPEDGELPQVPRFADDERTQLGTGFDELTGDLRATAPVGRAGRLITAWYGYYQTDAPRTDQCAPPFAPFNECLRYDEQFRTLVYGAYEGDLGPAARRLRLTLSWQRQHERRIHERPGSFTINGGRDDVDTVGVALSTRSERVALGGRDPETLGLRVDYGLDLYRDTLDTLAWLTFSDVAVTRLRSRGQYLDGSSYLQGGVFGEGELRIARVLDLRLGARLALARAEAPEDVESGTLGVDQSWVAAVGNAGIEWRPTRGLTLSLTADQGFRAPNLDDLTSRQQTGPGVQIENADLRPERSLSTELGLRFVSEAVALDAWAYRTAIFDGIERRTRSIADCPPATPACNSSWSQLQLVNLEDTATIYGAEGALRLWLPLSLEVRTSVSWARGTVPNPEERPRDPSADYDPRVELSRIPPINGTAELLWRGERGIYLGGAVRWAAAQDRLAPSDRSDARIPLGGTPGFAVLDLRAGFRPDRHVAVTAIVENVSDAAYRYHASSTNGAGRSVLLQLEGGL
jgi:outer membrane receptor protein involved in Fe transport